jgi:phenylacetate-CoA ligase
MAASQQALWNSEFETMPLATLRLIEEEKLRQQLQYVAVASPFYQRKWAAAGVSPKHVQRLEDLALLPFTEKSELQETQQTCPPLGANQCVPLDRLVRMQATGGTSGRPLRMALTRHDIEVYNEIGARAAWAAGLRPGDVLFECMNYSLYAGGVNDHMTFETVGACVAPVSVGQSRRLLEILQDMRIPTALYSTPSYVLHLAQVARDAGLDPAELGLRKGLFSGDAGLAIPGYREQIEITWKMTAQDIWGMGELGAPAAECEYRTGLHYLGQGLLLAEFIDPISGAVLPLADGAVGELVFTTLERQAHPLIRFRSHDYVQISLSPCPCGRTGFRFRILGRSDDMFIVKGINVFPLAVQDVLCAFRPEVTGEFQILLEEAPPLTGNPRLRVEVGTLAAEDYPNLQARLAQRIREVLVFTPDIELVPAGDLPRSEKKAKRLYRLYQGEQP